MVKIKDRKISFKKRPRPRKQKLQAVILAAGRGSRLHPITTRRSKAMLPIMGRPIIERVIEKLHTRGEVDEFIIVVSEDDYHLRRHFEKDSPLKVKIKFVTQPRRLGMANALAYAIGEIRGDFILSACDNLVPDDHITTLVATWRAQPKLEGLLSVVKSRDRKFLAKASVVKIANGRVKKITEKPTAREIVSNVAGLPLYIFTTKILKYLSKIPLSPRGEYELQDAIQMLIDDDHEVGFVTTKKRLRLTGSEDLLNINRHYLVSGGESPQLAPQTVGKGTKLITPLRIEEGTTIGEESTIGPRVYIERDCRIGSQVTIRDAVILRGAVIEDNTQISGEVVS